MVLALVCRDGVVLATDGKVSRASTSYRTVARIWQRANKTHPLPPRVLLSGAGEVGMIHEVADTLAELPEETRAGGIEAMLPHAREKLVELRGEAVGRYNAVYGAGAGAENAPKAFFLFVEADPAPRVVYVSEDGDVEDQTHLGYSAIGTGDLIVHVRMQPWDPRTLAVEDAAVLAFGLIKDTIDSGTFRVSDPVRVWTLRAGETPDEWDDARLARLEERYHAFRRAMPDLLRRS